MSKFIFYVDICQHQQYNLISPIQEGGEVMYMLIVYTYDDCLVYRCKSFKECVRTVQALTDVYTIIGIDIHKVPKTEISVRRE